MMQTRATSLAAGLLLAGTAFAIAYAGGAAAVPDDHLTPGAIASTDTAEVCGHVAGIAYSPRHRVWHDKRSTLAKYGLPESAARDYEDDDRVAVCLGGDNADPRNHWPQKWAEAREKDRLEALTCRMVCDGRESLTDAQAAFLGDWRQAYALTFGEQP